MVEKNPTIKNPKDPREKTQSIRRETPWSRFWHKLVGQAKKAKATVETRGGLSPVLSLESRVGLPKLRQMIHLQTERFVSQMIPLLNDKTVLEIGEGLPHFQNTIAARKPKIFCGVAVDENPLKISDNSQMLAKGAFRGIPFGSNFFDCVIARLATPHQGDVVTAFKELGRILMPEGMALVIDFHPFGLYAKTGTQRLRSHQATIRGLEDYYKMCRVAGLAISDVSEGFLDDTLRNQFATPEETHIFRELKGTPLVLFLMVNKLRPKLS